MDEASEFLWVRVFVISGEVNGGTSWATGSDGEEVRVWIRTATGSTKASLGLDQVDNTPDLAKPVSAPQQRAIDQIARRSDVFGEGGLIGAVAAQDAQGINRALLSFYDDGRVNIPGFLPGGAEFREVESVIGFSGYVFVQDGADGEEYVVSGLRANGQPFPIASDRSGVCYHVVMIGQSNCSADGATPVISTEGSAWGGKRFSRGLNTWVSGDHNADPENRDPGGFEFVPLNELGVESRATGLADTLKMLVSRRSRFSDPVLDNDYILISSTALGSRRLADIGPINSRGEGQYLTMLDDIRRAKAAAEARGDEYRLLGVVLDQGEKNGDLRLFDGGDVLSPSELIEGYRVQAVQFAQDFDSDARAITRQSQPVPTFVMTATYNLLTPEAWQRASIETDLIQLVGSRGTFQSALHDSYGNTDQAIHYSPDSHRTDIGERCARAIYSVQFEANGFMAPQVARAVKISDTSVQVFFESRSPLVYDDEAMPSVLDYGFTLRAGTLDAPGGAVRASGARITDGGRSALVSFTSVPAGCFLEFGANSLANIAVPAATLIGVATDDPRDAAARYSVTVQGDLSDELKGLIKLGHFFLYGSGIATSRGLIREVYYENDQTIFVGRYDELRTGGSYDAFQAGQTLSIGHTSPYTNIRDSSPALARAAYRQGQRAGTYSQLFNWALPRTGLIVEGA
jgi:hypothetical protein